MMIILMIVLVCAITAVPENRISSSEFSVVSNWTIDGFMALVSLFLAVGSAEMFNQGNWQRVWAAKDDKAMRKGFAIGSAMVFLLMFFFGIMGMISYAADPQGYNTFQKFAYLSFFYLLLPSPVWVNYLVLVLVTALAASSIDTLQNAIISVFSRDILAVPRCRTKVCGKVSLGAVSTRVLIMAINVPAVIMSAQRHDVISLFLIADLVCATAVFPVYLGLVAKPYFKGLFTPTTELGSLLGIITGLSSVLINGAILNFTTASNPYTGKVYATGPFAYFWLTNNDICALCGSKTMVTFIVTPIAGAFGAIIFSHLDIFIRGEERARKPLFAGFFKMIENKAGMVEKEEKPKYEFSLVGSAPKDVNGKVEVDEEEGADNNVI